MGGPDTPEVDEAVVKVAADSGLQDHSLPLALLAAIVESSDDAILSKTLDGSILSWNRGATRIFGYEPDEVIGRSIALIIPPELRDEERQIMDRIRRGQRVDHYDTARLARDGRRIPVSLSVSPIRDSRGVIIGASKVARDISERKQVEQAVREREEALREADRRKDEFLAQLAHELRNPLAPIRYGLAVSRKAGTLERWERAGEVIERQVGHMSRLLDDLLDISRITRGMFRLEKSPVGLADILDSALETARPFLNASRHRLSVDLPEPRVLLEADATRVVQVFSNLLINAARYTDPGGDIHLRARLEGPDVVVSVRDNGIGIPPELLPHIFNLYSRGRLAQERAKGGLGIGLSLVHGIVGLHGGTVEAHSDGVGRGSEMVVRLPLAAPPSMHRAAHADPGPAATGTGLKVLVVDDSRDAADTCASLLELSGHRTRTAYTGSDALRLAEMFRPNALLLDIGLPDMDGYQLARRVRASPWGSRAALIAVTGWGQREDRERAFAAGFDQHLTKPIAPQTLEALLRDLARRARP